MRITQCLTNDIRLQARYGFYYVYLFFCAAYILVLALLPPSAKALALPYIIFSDPAVLGLFIVGAFLLLERGDGTLEALFVTPLRPAEYLWSKALSLTLLALLTSSGIAVATKGAAIRLPLLLVGVSATSLFFIFFGVALATRCRGINVYVLLAGVCTAVFTLPLLDYFGLVESWLFFLLPTQGSLTLLAGAFSPSPPTPLALLASLLTLVVWTTGAYLWAHRWFCRYVIGRVQGST